jgi:subtilisin family serine protease
MKSIIGTFLVLSLVILGGCSQSPMPTSSDQTPTGQTMKKSLSTDVVPNSYIVVLSSKFQKIPAVAQARLDEVLRDFLLKHEITVTQRYENCLQGFAANMTAETAAIIARDPRVELVEQDLYVEAYAQSNPTGIVRIGAPYSSTQSGNGQAQTVSGVDVYIIDTGIQSNHPDLHVVGGRNFTGGSASSTNDQNGHGTHVSGTAAAIDNGSYVVGVAPGADLYAVKVLGSNGSGQLSWVIAGVNWVTQQKQQRNRPSVANMSLGATSSGWTTLDQAVRNSIAAGVIYCIAAGNNNADASGFSPAHVPEAITVGAYSSVSNSSYGGVNQFASFSNWGSMVDILAPGVNILSTYKGSGTTTMSGTSMATPHVTGTVALYLKSNPSASNATVLSDLINAANNPASGEGPNPSITNLPSNTTSLSVWASNF